MSAPAEFGGIDNSHLAALVFELASQLHVERARRLALEATLTRLGILDASQIEAAADGPSYRQQTALLADEAIRRLLEVLSESSDERKPLRAEAPASAAPPAADAESKHP
ncbi:MAG TPA: hypothetical protein VF745_13270 [Steroidobacteraceae bacterium]